MAQAARANLNKIQVVKGHMQIKRTGNTSVLTWKRINSHEEAVPAAIQEEKCKNVNPSLKVKRKRNINGQDTAIQARNTGRRKGDIGVLHLPSVRAQVLFPLITKAVGKSIAGEKEATAHHQSTREDIATVGEKADHEVGHHGNTAAVKKNGRASVNQRVTLIVELLVGVSRQNIVGNIRRRNIAENEDLPVHHRIMKGTVRRTENIRHESSVILWTIKVDFILFALCLCVFLVLTCTLVYPLLSYYLN